MTGLEYFAFCIRVSAKGTPLGLQFGPDFLIGQLESFAFRVGVLLFQPIGMLLATGLLCVSHRSVWQKAFRLVFFLQCNHYRKLGVAPGITCLEVYTDYDNAP